MLRHRRMLAATFDFFDVDRHERPGWRLPIRRRKRPPTVGAPSTIRYYVGYTGRHWNDDYGIREGRCDRDRVGTVLGAVVGGAVGSAVGNDDNRLIAILAGATIGAIIGHEIGEDMDRQ